MTAAAADRETKGKVEALGATRSDRMPAEGFASLDAANRRGRLWMDEANAAVHLETRAAPVERLAVERPLSPAAGAPVVASGERRPVDKCATVRVASARYSVRRTSSANGWRCRSLATRSVTTRAWRWPAPAPGPRWATDRCTHYPTPPPTGSRRCAP